jgi:nucleotidyltransferase substrate binding protein (TIGR01987 family)
MEQDIRWKQRLNNYKKALNNLEEGVQLSKQRQLNKLEKQGIIQAFEIVYELAWNTVKDFYNEQGETNIQGSRDAFRMAFNRGLIDDGVVFMEIIKSRQLTSHTYNEDTAEEILKDIINTYFEVFKNLKERLEKIK